MGLDSTDIGLIKRLIHGRARKEPAVFNGEETKRLLAMMDARVLKETSIILWRTSPGATQNLSEDEFLAAEGVSFFLR